MARAALQIGQFLLTLPAIALLAGCGDSGPDIGYVEGTVTLNDKPLEGALVAFTPEKGGRPSYGRTNAEGWYELTYTEDRMGAVPGKHSVEITTYRSGDPDQGIEKVPEELPAKYNTQTELTETVEAGDNVIPFELNSEGEVVQPSEAF